ncbi:MAG: hypothetical protein LBU32_10200 [Clostridiales bacterium]|jgi:hypothetical protein|nr:hypothetical protein [Clostridiales bacterium]
MAPREKQEKSGEYTHQAFFFTYSLPRNMQKMSDKTSWMQLEAVADARTPALKYQAILSISCANSA